MPVDANIALGVRPVEPVNMLGQMGQMMQLRQANDEYESNNALKDFYAQGGDLSRPEDQRRLMSTVGAKGADLIAKQMFAIPPPLRRPADAEPLPPLLEPLRLALLAKEAANRPGSAEELRKRWAEVFSSPGHRQLPSADRAARLPAWTFAEPKVISSPSLELGWVAIVMVGPPPHDLAKDGVRMALELAGLRLQIPSLADVILLDASTDGEAAIAYLRASDRPQTPIVVCLKTGGGDQLAALIAAGAADVLAYPVEVSRLVPKLRRIQSRRRWAK